MTRIDRATRDAAVAAPIDRPESGHETSRLACGAGHELAWAPWPSRELRCVKDGVPDGPMLALFPDDTVEIEATFADGKLDGRWTRHYPGGAIELEGAFAAGAMDGTWTQYAPDGAVLGRLTFDHGAGTDRRWRTDGSVIYERSLPDGLERWFAPDGSTVVEQTWANGVLDGKRVIDTKQTVRLEETRAAGVLRGVRRLWRKGYLAIEEHYDNDGALHGAYAAWRSRKKKYVEGSYRHGSRDGTWTWWDSDGAATLSGNWTKGKMDGEFVVSVKGAELGRYTMTKGSGTEQTFARGKTVVSETTWVRGVREGVYRVLGPSGKPILLGAYKNDRRDGVWVRYDWKTGSVVRETHYAAGKRDGAYVAGSVSASFAAGARDGAYKETRDDGTPAVVGEYRNDRKHGEWLRYAPGGVLVARETWVDGRLDGPYFRYYADGAVSVKGSFSAGRRTGTWTELRPDGTAVIVDTAGP